MPVVFSISISYHYEGLRPLLDYRAVASIPTGQRSCRERTMHRPGPTPRQLQGSLPRSPPLAGAPPARAPLHAIKLEVEDAVLLGSTEPGHRQCGCSHRGPDAVISCHREEGLAKLDTRAQMNQQTPKGQ